MKPFHVALLLAASSLVACRAPTEIRVDVSTDVKCGDWHGAAIAVGELGPGLEGAIPSTSTTSCDDAGHVGSVVVIPSGDPGANVAIKVVGAVDHGLEACTEDAGYEGCIVARRSLRFIPHETLSLAMPLLHSCKDVPCGASDTCVEGLCHPATIADPGACADTTCGESALPSQIDDGGAPRDATVNDGSAEDGASDATASDAADAGGGEDAASDSPVAPPIDAAGAGCGQNCAISAGESFACALRDGGVVCWGQDFNGETGNGTQVSPAPPAFVGAAGGGTLVGVRGLVSGLDTSCAFLSDGGAACWGGEAPLGVAAPQLVATPAPFLAGAPLVTIGNFHMCWQNAGGTFECQCHDGCDDSQEFLAYDGSDSGVPLQTPLASSPAPGPYAQLESTVYFTCVLASGGGVYCLGKNDLNEVDPTSGSQVIPTFTRYPKLSAPALEVEIGGEGACARTAGHVYCWGTNGVDSQGINGNLAEILYADGGSLDTAVEIAAGFAFDCARLADGRVACWGDNASHQLGRGESVASGGGASVAAALVVDGVGGALANVAGVAAGSLHACAVKNDGTTWCWGDNGSGQLGQDGGAPAVSSIPLRVAY